MTQSIAADADINDVLDGVGPRIRQFRTQAGLSLRQLADRCELSTGFLSQVERGRSSIALSTLRTVATALQHPIADFFTTSLESTAGLDDQGSQEVVFTLNRQSDRPQRVVSGGRHYEMLSARVPGLVLEPMLVFIEPGSTREDPTSHAGEEFAYILEGELLYRVGDTDHRLFPGDSLHLRSNTPHAMHNDTDRVTVVVSVVTPRLF